MFFFFNDTPTTEIYTLSLHDALPIWPRRLLLADEPTGALDSATGEEILRVLRARCEAGAAGVLVTHDARHAAWADRVVFLRDGVVVDQSGCSPVESLLTGDGAR